MVGIKRFCCLLDTGAQISLVNVGVLNQFSLGDIVIHNCDNGLIGLGNDETKVGGYANLNLRLYCQDVLFNTTACCVKYLILLETVF